MAKVSSFPRRRESSRLALITGALAIFWALFSVANPHIEIEGLMPPNSAVLNIDGDRKLLKVGQSHAGVTLISVYSQTATLEVDGKQSVLGLTSRVGTNYQPVVEKTFDIPRNSMLQYRTTAYINGRKAEVMVDTGANIIAMNSAEALRLGIPPNQGQPVQLETASQKLPGRQVKLRSVDVGGIRVDGVEAVVMEGDYPRVTLLGMSYLKHVKIQENQGIMTLFSTY